MKTQWTIIGVVVLGVAAAAPWGVGYYTEQQWRGVQEGLNDSQSLVQLQTREYSRGYMSAKVQGSVVMVAPETGERHIFDYQAQVSHGVTGSLMDFSTAEALGEDAERFFPDEKPRLTLETRVWGTARVEIIVPETEATNEATGESISIARAHGSADIGSAGAEVVIDVDWPGMTMTGPDARISVTDFSMDQTMEHLVGDLWLGDAEIRLAGFQFQGVGQPAMSLSKLSMISDSRSSADASRMSGGITMQLEKVAANGAEFGPHEIRFEFDDMDVASFDEVSSAVNEMQQATLTSAGNADPQALMEQQMQSLQKVSSAMLGLAAEGFSFGFPEIDLSTPEGPIRGEMIVSHPELTDEEKSEAMMVMQGLTGNFDISMPAALVDGTPALAMQVAPLIKQGMVVQEGERLRMIGTLEDMAININGQVLPLPPVF